MEDRLRLYWRVVGSVCLEVRVAIRLEPVLDVMDAVAAEAEAIEWRESVAS